MLKVVNIHGVIIEVNESKIKLMGKELNVEEARAVKEFLHIACTQAHEALKVEKNG